MAASAARAAALAHPLRPARSGDSRRASSRRAGGAAWRQGRAWARRRTGARRPPRRRQRHARGSGAARGTALRSPSCGSSRRGPRTHNTTTQSHTITRAHVHARARAHTHTHTRRGSAASGAALPCEGGGRKFSLPRGLFQARCRDCVPGAGGDTARRRGRDGTRVVGFPCVAGTARMGLPWRRLQRLRRWRWWWRRGGGCCRCCCCCGRRRCRRRCFCSFESLKRMRNEDLVSK